MEMKYYITYGNWKPEISGSVEKVNKAFEDWSKHVKEAGMEIVFWGSPLGVSEDAVFVYKGTPANYPKILTNAPYTHSRTNIVMKI
jgi:hypothetical protein